MNDGVFVAKGYEHIYASSGYRLNLAFCGCLNDVEARAYVRRASYASGYNLLRFKKAFDKVPHQRLLLKLKARPWHRKWYD